MSENKEDREVATLFFQTHWKTINRICQEEAKKHAYRVRKYEKCLTVEDLKQEALLNVLLNAKSFDSRRAENGVEGFIYNCANSAIIDALRRYGNPIEKTTEEEPEHIVPALLPYGYTYDYVANSAFRWESEVTDLLDLLPGHQRAIVEFKFGINCFCEHSDENVAKEFGLSRPTVKKEINCAMHNLRQYIIPMNSGHMVA